MIGGGLGAFIYDRIFSTRSVLRSGGSKEGKEFNKMDMSKEVYINEASSIEHSELWTGVEVQEQSYSAVILRIILYYMYIYTGIDWYWWIHSRFMKQIGYVVCF